MRKSRCPIRRIIRRRLIQSTLWIFSLRWFLQSGQSLRWSMSQTLSMSSHEALKFNGPIRSFLIPSRKTLTLSRKQAFLSRALHATVHLSKLVNNNLTRKLNPPQKKRRVQRPDLFPLEISLPKRQLRQQRLPHLLLHLHRNLRLGPNSVRHCHPKAVFSFETIINSTIQLFFQSMHSSIKKIAFDKVFQVAQ